MKVTLHSSQIFTSCTLYVYALNTQGSKENIIVGSHVWVEDHELAWLDGKVSKITGQDAEIEASNGKKVHQMP
jgi:myosin-5